MGGTEQRVTVMFDGYSQRGDLACFVCNTVGEDGIALDLLCNEKGCADEAVEMFGHGAQSSQRGAMGGLKVGGCDPHSSNLEALARRAHDKGFFTPEFIQKAREVVVVEQGSVKGTADLLIVDDDPHWRHDLVESLLFADIKATCALAENGLEAQRILGEEPNVKVVVTDLAMPQMDGLALTEWIKANRPDVVVILRSGTLGNSDRAAARASGADHVLDKADNEKVIGEIRKVLVPLT